MLTITDLPRVMQDKEHWPVAAACMRRWFQNGASQLSPRARTGGVDMSALPPGQLETRLLQMSWALSFPRVKAAYDTLITTTWRNAAAQRRMAALARLQAADPAARETLSGGKPFGDPSAPVKVLDTTAQVNFVTVGAVSDPLDDFYGAVGRAELKAAAFGRIVSKPKGFRLTVSKLGVYLRDTYDYNGDQWLGLWSENGIERGRLAEAWGMYLGGYPSIPIDPAADSKKDADTKYSVENKDFRAYRDKHGRGGDFINVSDVRIVALPQPVSFDFP